MRKEKRQDFMLNNFMLREEENEKKSLKQKQRSQVEENSNEEANSNKMKKPSMTKASNLIIIKEPSGPPMGPPACPLRRPARMARRTETSWPLNRYYRVGPLAARNPLVLITIAILLSAQLIILLSANESTRWFKDVEGADSFGSRRLSNDAPEESPFASALEGGESGSTNTNNNNNMFLSRQGQLQPGAVVATSGGEQPQQRRPPLRQQQPLASLGSGQSNQALQRANFNQQSQQPQVNNRARQQQQQQQIAANQNRQQQQQQQNSDQAAAQANNQNSLLGVELPQPRFQRLRTPPGGPINGLINGGEQAPQQQFLNSNNNNLNNAASNSNNQQAQQQNSLRPIQIQNNNNNNNFPTLTAFDLTSLANLANQAQLNNNNNNNNNLNQQQAPFRRLQSQQQQQVARANSNQQFDSPAGRGGLPPLAPPAPQQQPQAQSQQQVPNQKQQQAFANNNIINNNGPAQTELPFIRQVFRPASGPLTLSALGAESAINNFNSPTSAANGGLLLPNVLELENQRAQQSQRPTPPPLFVPARAGNNQANRFSGSAAAANSRLIETGGFSPMQSVSNNNNNNNNLQSLAPNSGRELFFEPTQRIPAQQQQQRNRNGLNPNQSQQQQPSAPRQQQQQPAASDQSVQNVSSRKPARRPSQRPQLPSSSSAAAAAAAEALGVGAANSNQQQTSATDVIRLASSAIQAANDGLAAFQMQNQNLPQAPSEFSLAGGNGGASTPFSPNTMMMMMNNNAFTPSTTTSSTSGGGDQQHSTVGLPAAAGGASSQLGAAAPLALSSPSSAAASATTTFGLPLGVTISPATGEPIGSDLGTTTTAASAGGAQQFAFQSLDGSGSGRAFPGPLRTSANFFTLTSASTSSPTSFSPALPINAAAAATVGGRRRIPVRSSTTTTSSMSGQSFSTTRAQTTTTTTTTLATTRGAGSEQQAPATTLQPPTTGSGQRQSQPQQSPASTSVRRPEIEEFYETIGNNGFSSTNLNEPTTIDGFGAPSRLSPAASGGGGGAAAATTATATSTTTTTNSPGADLYGSRLSGNGPNSEQGEQSQATTVSSFSSVDGKSTGNNNIQSIRNGGAGEQTLNRQQAGSPSANTNKQQAEAQPANLMEIGQVQPVMVPVTYLTTMTYLTTVVHGTHTLETSHETLIRSTELATLNAQLMDQIEHKLPLIEPTATVSVSSKTKGKGTTIVNLKSAISAYNQELVEALGAAGGNVATTIQPTAVAQLSPALSSSSLPSNNGNKLTSNKFKAQHQNQNQHQKLKERQRAAPAGVSSPPTTTTSQLDLLDLQEAKKSLINEYIYLYTIKPIGADSSAVEPSIIRSVRSEFVTVPPAAGSVDGQAPDLLMKLIGGRPFDQQSGGVHLIDSNGMLRINQEPANLAPINLGTTIGKDGSMITEVNMNIASYIKFEDISNAIVDVKPTKVANFNSSPEDPTTKPFGSATTTGNNIHPFQLDTSFDLHLAFNNALDKLQASQQTPALDLLNQSQATASLPKLSAITVTTTAPSSNQQIKSSEDLLRADLQSANINGNISRQASAVSSLVARSQLRSRVASSRFRTSPMQQSGSQLSLSNSNKQSGLASGEQQLVAVSSSLVAPSGGSSRLAGQRPIRSRIVRPQQQNKSDLNEIVPTSSSGPAAAPSAPASAGTAPSSVAGGPAGNSVIRSSKPRFVVVTRTGQFGIRASAMSSMASSNGNNVEPASATSAAPVLATNQVRSKISKPSRIFRGSSSAVSQQASIQPTKLVADQFATTTLPEVVSSSTSKNSDESSTPSTSSTTTTPTTTNGLSSTTNNNNNNSDLSATGNNSDQQSSTTTAAAAAAASGQDNNNLWQATTTTTTTAAAAAAGAGNGNAQSGNQQADGGDSAMPVIVTYFTTTTHTIPFTISSETIFTTIEETNSRIATEYMKDLTGQFIEPTPMVTTITPTTLPTVLGATNQQSASTTTAQTTTTTASGSEQASSFAPTTSSTLPTSGGSMEKDDGVATTTTTPTVVKQQAAPVQQQQQQSSFDQSIEPSFVLSLNTRTYFTTYTYFTTFSAGSASPTIKSSESTTSSVVTETVTSLLEPTRIVSSVMPSAQLSSASSQQPSGTGNPSDFVTSSPVLEQASTSEQSSADIRETAQQQQQLTTKTLLSTMTYYGTLYNGTQTSLTPIFDISTQVLTLSSPAFNSNLNSENIALMSASSSGVEQIIPTSMMELPTIQQSSRINSVEGPSTALNPSEIMMMNNPDKITRTRSLYTTLTHYITFYSGTKTQLSTIQEISPTVVTEYIDRTLFEQQQASDSSQASISLVVPTQINGLDMNMLSLTPSPVLPELMSTTTASSQAPAQTTTTTEPTSSQPQTTTTSAQPSSSSSSSPSSSETTTSAGSSTSSTTTSTETSAPELSSVEVNKPNNGQINSDNQSADSQSASNSGRVAASTDQDGAQQQGRTNIIELSDLIAANSSQSGRVALAGNLGAAIKDIVQLLAGNKTAPNGAPLLTSQQPAQELATTEQATSPSSTTTTQQQQQQPKRIQAGKVFGQKAKQEQQHLLSLQGSITSPSLMADSRQQQQQQQEQQQTTPTSSLSAKPTPELSSSVRGDQLASTREQQQQQPAAAATIFFGDDGSDERKKQIKTVWMASQSTQFVTSVEASTRSLLVTTTKVYYTRDSPMTITSSYTSVLAPRTFVSTIVGTRTHVNQLQSTQTPTQQAGASPSSLLAAKVPSATSREQPSRQDSQAANHRLSVQQKQQKQQVQQEQQQKKLQQQQQQQQAAQAKQQQKQAKTNEQTITSANINQCQPMCKISQNEICKFTPSSETIGAQGTFSCACRPGYYMSLNSVGQRQCQEVQSYVVLMRLLQIGDQQISFKKELQDRFSPEYKQYSRIIRDHVKRAYMTSDITRERFVGADVINFARSMGLDKQQPALNGAKTIPTTNNSSSFSLADNGALNAGIIVNITVQLQPPNQNTNEVLDENTLKEELTKKLNLRQAAALAAQAAQAATGASSLSAGEQAATGSESELGKSTLGNNNSNSSSSSYSLSMSENGGNAELLPNPNALFLADVEQVMDLDECANPTLNDCHEAATCINEVGSYKCDCREYPDLNPAHPGRQCANELKSCEYCYNRGDCIRIPSLLLLSPPTSATNSSSSMTASSSSLTAAGTASSTSGSGSGSQSSSTKSPFTTICQCHRLYLGRRCQFNGYIILISIPAVLICFFVAAGLSYYCCRRWRKQNALSKGFRNIGTFGPNLIGGTLDRKAMLESSSESSDTHQRSHHHHHHHHLRGAAGSHHHHHLLVNSGGVLGAAQTGPSGAAGLYADGGASGAEPTSSSSSNESSPRQMVRNQMVAEHNAAAAAAYHMSPHLIDTRQAAGAPAQAQQASQQQQQSSLGPYCSSIPPQIVIPRARHNQVNYAVHRGQVYMW